jgi:molybdopterin converting factor small subunit
VGKVTVKFHGIVKGKDVEGTEEYEVPAGTTVRDMAERFAKGHRASFEEGATSSQGEKLLETHIVMLNGMGLSPEKQLTTQVKEGDSVTIYLPVGGG